MTVLRFGLTISSLLWVMLLVSMWQDGTGPEKVELSLPVIAVACYLLYLIPALVTRRTLWLETCLVGLAILPLIVGVVVAGLAALWGGLRWIRTRTHGDTGDGSRTSLPTGG